MDLILQQLTFYKAHYKTESHSQQIQDAEMMRQKLDYIHYNPVKRGYVDEPVHWRYSSARNYAGEQGMLEITQIWRAFCQTELNGFRVTRCFIRAAGVSE